MKPALAVGWGWHHGWGWHGIWGWHPTLVRSWWLVITDLRNMGY
ncbi:MAG: hypothetical protein WBE68_07475 [Candidatus Nitrosopolaris sp.]